MKKNILIPLFVLCIAHAFGQTGWPSIGAKWHYSYMPCDIWGGCNEKEYIYFEAVKDTLVNDTLCTKIIVEHHNGKKEVKYLGDEFIYSTENQVYSFHHGHFNLLYDFSVQVGDTVELFVDSNCKLFQQLENSDHSAFDSKPIKYAVTKKDSVSVGGINTTSIELKFLEYVSMPRLSFESQQIVKNIGSLDFLFGNFFTGIESGFYGPLRCYSDSVVNYTTETPCDYISGAAAQEYQYVPFPDSGAVWSEMYNPSFGDDDEYTKFERFTLTGEDTLINNIQYKKLYIYLDKTFNKSNARCVGGIREDDQKKVYLKCDSVVHRFKPYWILTPMNEILMYDFSLEIGDSIIGNYGFQLLLADIDTLLIGNSLRKVFNFNCEQSLCTTWIEGIGNTKGLIFSSGGLPTDGTNGSLICFFLNGEELYHNDFYNDCFPPNVGVELKKLNLGIQVYPNPASGNTIRFEWKTGEIETVEIFNLLGEPISLVTVSGRTFVDYSTNKMQPGIYLYKATDKNKFYQTGRFVVE